MALLRRLQYGSAYAFGLFVGSVYCLNVWASLIVFVLSSLLNPFSELLISAVCGVVISIPFLIHWKLGKKVNKWLLLGYIALAQVFPFVFNFADSLWIQNLLYLGIATVFSFVCIYVLRALFVRGLKYKLATDEQICLATFTVCLACACAYVCLGQVCFLDIVACALILITMSVMGGKTSFFVAVVLGLGYSVATGSLTPIAVYSLWAVAAVCFYPLSRYISIVALLLAQLVLVYFFSAYGNNSWQSFIAVGIACLCYGVIPNKTLRYLKDVLGQARQQYAPGGIINKIRFNMARRLYELADIFFSMQLAYKGLVRKTLSPEQATYAIGKEVCDKVCYDCVEKNRCWRVNVRSTEQSFGEIVTAGLDRGKATLLDVSSALTSTCLRLSTVLSTVNREVTAYLEYYQQATSSANSKLLIAEQLGGVSKIMLNLGGTCKNKLLFDHEKEKLAMQELTFFNCLTKEVVIWQEDSNLYCTVTVHVQDAEKEVIAPTLSKICCVPLTLDSVEGAEDNWKILFFKPKTVFNVAFGIAQISKHGSEKSGDTHSFVKLGNDKFLIALCDGMGSGVEAEQSSSTAISLVENFYKAGFDSDVILSGVNKLLIADDRETFTAMDICVIDLQKGLTDFIKLSAPNSIVKCESEVQFIQGGSLPLGVLAEMRPVITKKVLRSGDLVVLISDGFADCFATLNTVAQHVANNVLTNPQIVADNLLNLAREHCGGVFPDDASVIVARIVAA